MAITFAKPPINEVVLGQTFLQRNDLLIPYIGEFWARVQREYPKCSHAAPIVTPGSTTTFNLETNFPRVWFISDDDTRLVQLQQDRLYVNWRQTKAREEYIRFAPIKKEFDRVFAEFRAYLKARVGEDITPRRYELNYINIIDCGVGWRTGADIGDVLRDIGWSGAKRFLPGPRRVSAKYEFAMPDGFGALLVSLDPAKTVGSELDVLRLELAAVADADVVAKVPFDAWVEIAHDWIVSGFKDLTTPAMHTDHWKLQG